MRLFIGGARGSMPAVGSQFDEFGGHTTSMLLVASDNRHLVLDAGTGLQPIAAHLARSGPTDVTVLFSHYHLDHMVGLTMNPLFYRPNWSFRFMGPVLVDSDVRTAFTRLMSPPYWPVTCDIMAASIEFADFTESEMTLGSLIVRSCPIPHPGGCSAYRIEEHGSRASIVYATDIEWAAGTPAQQQAFTDLCSLPTPADVLYIDAHFARTEAAAFAGIGHTCWEDCLDIAASTGVRRVLLGHHRPQADDTMLRDLLEQVRKRSTDAEPARAGTWLQIGQ